MNPLRIVRCISGTFQSEIDMGDFTKKIALTSSGGKSHSRGEAIIVKSGFILGYNIDIERKIKYTAPYCPEGKTQKQWQSQVDVVFSNQEETEHALIEYESTDLIESTVFKKLASWRCYYPNPNIKLLCVVVVGLHKENLEQSWELKDRTILIERFTSGMKTISKELPENSFSVIAISDDSITSYYYKEGKDNIQKYNIIWR